MYTFTDIHKIYKRDGLQHAVQTIQNELENLGLPSMSQNLIEYSKSELFTDLYRVRLECTVEEFSFIEYAYASTLLEFYFILSTYQPITK